MSQFILNISNDNDLPDLLFQGGFSVQFIIDERHGVEYVNIEPDKKEQVIEDQGIRNIERIDFMQQKELSFNIDADGARFLSRLKLMDTFTYTDYRSEVITPDEWDVKIDEPNPGLDTHYVKVTIKIKINSFSKLSSNVNFVEILAVPVTTKPTAINVLITGSNFLGELLTGNYDYVTNGGAEGATAFRWFRADDSLGTNKQFISGAINQTYGIISPDLNKWVQFQVKPLSVEDITDGDWTASPYFNIQNNVAPVASNVAKSQGTVTVGFEVTGSYVYSDADGDAEIGGGSLQEWYTRNVDRSNLTKVHTGSAWTPQPLDQNKEFAFAVTPKADTGITTGDQIFSVWGAVLEP